jgi:hypothetical protein
MALEISIDEVNTLSELAWRLYQHGFKVARAVSPELQSLFSEISVLAHSTNILKEDACNPESVLVQASGDRIRIVNEMVARIKMTLLEVEKSFTRHKIFSAANNSQRRSIWAKLGSWTGFGSVDSYRRKVSRPLSSRRVRIAARYLTAIVPQHIHEFTIDINWEVSPLIFLTQGHILTLAQVLQWNALNWHLQPWRLI